MAETVSGTATSTSQFLHQNVEPLSVTYQGNVQDTYQRQFASTDVSKIYFNNYSVTTTPTTIDLTALTDSYGQAISFNTVKHLQIINNDGTNNLTVGGGTNALFSALPALVGQSPSNGSTGSCVNLTTNITVSGTQKVLQLVASAGTISVDVIVVGN